LGNGLFQIPVFLYNLLKTLCQTLVTKLLGASAKPSPPLPGRPPQGDTPEQRDHQDEKVMPENHKTVFLFLSGTIFKIYHDEKNPGLIGYVTLFSIDAGFFP
jgi:hypothetical protein